MWRLLLRNQALISLGAQRGSFLPAGAACTRGHGTWAGSQSHSSPLHRSHHPQPRSWCLKQLPHFCPAKPYSSFKTQIESHLFYEAQSSPLGRIRLSIRWALSLWSALLGPCLCFCLFVCLGRFPSLQGLGFLKAEFQFILVGLLSTSGSSSHRINL